MPLRKWAATTSRSLSHLATNSWLAKGFAFAAEHVDNRRIIETAHGRFSLRMGNTLERWRADTLASKEPETIAWLDETISEDSVFYDVGANIGLYSLYALHRFPGKVRAVCFEPESLNFARLNQNLYDNGFSLQATPFAIGLGQTRAITRFRLSRLQTGRALHGERHVAEGAQDHQQGLLVCSLDELVLGDSGLPEPTHLKIDVDGPELDIVRGAQKTLALPSLRHVLVELEDSERAEVSGILAGSGFRETAEGRDEGGMRNIIYRKEELT